MSFRPTSIREIFDDHEGDDTDRAALALETLVEGAFYQGFLACTVAVGDAIEQGATRHQLIRQIGAWVLESQARSLALIDEIDDELAAKLRHPIHPSTPGSN